MNKQDKRWGLYSICGITLLILFSNFILDANRFDRITTIECSLGLKECVTASAILSQPNPLEGWNEECIEQEVIIHDRFLVKVNGKSGIVGLEIEYSNTHWDRPIFNETHKLQETWNTTKCIKWILVKEERP